MANILPGYDQWLEEPYQRACDEAERFMDWCDERNIDYDDPQAESRYVEWLQNQWEAAGLDELDEYERDDFYG